ncbi:hypothetical protein [Streptomyces lunaelactis]|nr:hypothetical protein [Streptomyces lunaelactis]
MDEVRLVAVGEGPDADGRGLPARQGDHARGLDVRGEDRGDPD